MRELTLNEVGALTSAVDNYLNGNGMEDGDEDESTLESLVQLLTGARVYVDD